MGSVLSAIAAIGAGLKAGWQIIQLIYSLWKNYQETKDKENLDSEIHNSDQTGRP